MDSLISAKEAVPMKTVWHKSIAWVHVNKNNGRSNLIYPTIDSIHEPVTLTLLEQKLLQERAAQDIRHVAIFGIISAILVGVILIGILALTFSLQSDVPTGTIFLYSGTSLVLPQQNDQWLFCNGSEVSRAIYQGLFAVIGIRYGPGNGIDTFNLPDLRSRFPLGSSTSSSATVAVGGSSTHSITVAELPAHNHDYGSLQTVSAGTHAHTYSDPGHNHGGSTGTAIYGSGSFAMVNSGGYGNDNGAHSHTIPVGQIGITIQSSGSHTHPIIGSTNTTGQGQPIDKMPPYQTVNYIIRT